MNADSTVSAVMPSACHTAFKEWAVICRALARGRQRVILRKGGIIEPGGRFQLQHRDFLLMPTFVHQASDSIVPEARDLLVDIDADRSPEGTVVFRHRARVIDAVRIESLDSLSRFRGDHVWADHVVAERFHRWRDELHVLQVEVSSLPEPLVVPWRDSFGGCKSWVEV